MYEQLCYCKDCARRAPPVFSERMTSLSALKIRLRIKTKIGFGFIQDHRFRTDGFIIRAKSMIRADGFSSAQQTHITAAGVIEDVTNGRVAPP